MPPSPPSLKPVPSFSPLPSPPTFPPGAPCLQDDCRLTGIARTGEGSGRAHKCLLFASSYRRPGVSTEGGGALNTGADKRDNRQPEVFFVFWRACVCWCPKRLRLENVEAQMYYKVNFNYCIHSNVFVLFLHLYAAVDIRWSRYGLPITSTFTSSPTWQLRSQTFATRIGAEQAEGDKQGT